jgi:hypothetical protein
MSKMNLSPGSATNGSTSNVVAIKSALAMPLIRALLLLLALSSPAMAGSGAESGSDLAARATGATSQLQTYLDTVLKNGGRPDYSKPPASDLLDQVFDLKAFEALPPVQGNDLPWLLDWITAANNAFKSITAFGIAPPVNVQTDAAALARNFADYQDQEAAASNFLLRSAAREIQAAFAFMSDLPLAQRTPVRIEGFRKMRAANAQYMVLYLGCIVPGMTPANARLISTAIRDTGPVWATTILPGDRPMVLAALAKGEAAVKDDEIRDNLAYVQALLTEAK